MPANTPSRKSFTGTRLRSLEYRRRRYWLVLAARYADVPLSVRVGGTYSHIRTHTHDDEFTGYTHTKCPARTRIDLAYPIDRYIGPSLPSSRSTVSTSRSPVIRNFTSYFKIHDAAISRPTMRAPLAHPFFFSAPSRVLDHAPSLGLPCETREEKQASWNRAIFSFHCSAIRYISLRRRLSAL